MIIGVLGLIDSGKGTVGDILCEDHKFVRDSFAAPLKDAVSAIFGWPRALLEGDTKESREFREKQDAYWTMKLAKKYPGQKVTPRWVLQYIGSEVFRDAFFTDIWTSSLEYRLLGQPGQHRVITDARFPNEFDMIKRMGGFLIRVQRGPLPVWWNAAVKYNYNLGRSPGEGFPPELQFIHISEYSIAGYPADYMIMNDGTLEQLESNIKYALTALKGPDILFDNPKGEK